MVNPDLLVGFVDDWIDKDPKTRDSSPGKVKGHKLILIAKQTERRLKYLFLKRTIKNWIFLLDGTHDLIYKQSFNNAGYAVMGLSLKLQDWHPKSVPMETYYDKFVAHPDKSWLALNDFELV